jgi:hypothetical protein
MLIATESHFLFTLQENEQDGQNNAHRRSVDKYAH